jgi:hypothetical protein
MSTVLRDERRKADGLHGVFQIRFILRRNPDDMDLREGLLDVLRGLDAIFAGHFHIHNNDVGASRKARSMASSPSAASPTTVKHW